MSTGEPSFRQSFFRALRRVFLILLLAALVFTKPWEFLPPELKPWAPLALHHPMNSITRVKLSRLRDSPEACLAALETAREERLDYLPLEDYTPVESCPLTNVVRVRRTGVGFNTPFTLSCPLLVRWLMFEEQQLQPLALQHLGSRVSTVEHYGTFSCRNVYGRATGRRSQHATASAFDVAAFRFENGIEANILNDWNNEREPEKRAFLHEAHRAACTYFGTVLGPDYNDPHANHFHLDTSRFNLCR